MNRAHHSRPLRRSALPRNFGQLVIDDATTRGDLGSRERPNDGRMSACGI
jgi:hypothetical protein